ncbi:hypothetical protein [Nocardia goodfellowii]|uniref:Phage tail tape measure protein n=1 Tax=Nocardia goodfellowii TaxID=882446 RepID=A0ABS4QPM6_9NOCA|nr:hypothetical protein [Nocardia goodfellowii]MBP2192969.1 hypothetical protein [Nocardia goodfellowii]
MDDVITALGLLLTQTRYARRALEDIERTTTRYSLSAMTAFGSGTGGFGAPPLHEGALRVYVVNLSDLEPGRGFGDALAGLLGGVGSFVGNLFGGVVGGTAGSWWLARSLQTIDRIVERVERIIARLGLGRSAAPAISAPMAPAAVPPAATEAPIDLVATLKSVRGRFEVVTALLRAAHGEFARPTAAGAAPGPAPSDAERWRGLADSLTVAFDAATRLAGGLLTVVPTAIAALSWLLDRLPRLRNAIVDMLRFAVRNVLVLRGAVVVLALETLAMIVRVAALAVRTLSATLTEALGAVFTAIGGVLDGALRLVGVVGAAVVKTANALLNWLVPAVDKILREIGALRVFGLLSKVVDLVPLLAAKGKADGATTPSPGTKGTGDAGRLPLTLPPVPPDLAEIMATAGTEAKAAAKKIGDAGADLVSKPTAALREGLTSFSESLDKAALEEVERSDRTLADRLPKLGAQADRTAAELLPPLPAAPTDFAPIAEAYGRWLVDSGLGRLLDQAGTYFATPRAGPDFAKQPQLGAPAAVIRIDEVVIDIAPAAAPEEPPPQSFWRPEEPAGPGADIRDRIAGRDRFDAIRGTLFQPRPYVPQVG